MEPVQKIFKGDYSLSDKSNFVIPEGVTEIDKAACRNSDMQSISLPSTLIRIGEDAFDHCEQLRTVDFSLCTHLKEIEKGAFSRCEKLLKVDFSQCCQLETIGDSAFACCSDLNTVILPSSLKSIGHFAFEYSNIMGLDFSSCRQLEHIGKQSFYSCQSLTSLDLSATSVKFIGETAFSRCEQLTNVLLPETLVEIGENAFSSTAITEIVIPDSVERIGVCAFSYNQQLIRAIIGRKAKNYFSQNNPIFGQSRNLSELTFRSEVAEYTGACGLTKVNFADTVKELGQWAVAECNIEEVVVPDSVEKIGYGAFVSCKNLSSVVLSDNISEIGDDVFALTRVKEIAFPRELRKLGRMGNNMEKLRKLDFSKVTKLKIIPENFISHDVPKLKELVLPIGVTKIEENIGGENLSKLFLPPTINEIEELYQTSLDIYCFAPAIEELEPIVAELDDEEDAIHLYVLPEYVDSYKAQRDAEDISEKILIIDVIPEEYRYYYDN